MARKKATEASAEPSGTLAREAGQVLKLHGFLDRLVSERKISSLVADIIKREAGSDF